ncbi:SusC/RagA family TonB-linked outer membrane protein [Pseudoflavitalea sp. X16]|uniref:SusC/RagA family TonB-linked outer membrane protein n=1 Tax=Paraflavitalea devenefica TaxID=2716334 RepID=UPI001423AF8A|nr:SusC/RagA family TonB-linked outer membrane protein [Paraflavitalea devenefica]NII29089.1 SusC/RagA family TonB-linked outer membrane protein [Paraflavitalea devenefica]
MRLTIFLLTAAFLNVQARTFSQEVTFSGRDVPLQKVFNAIEKQTGYVFFYNTGLLRLANPVTLEVKKKPLMEVLKACMASQPLDFEIENTTIVILKKAAPPMLAGPDAAEPIRITGVVIDQETKQPLAGASIQVKETRARAITNEEGFFEIMASPGNTLLISYIGFDNKTLKVEEAAQGILTVPLARRISSLQEVNVKVSTGYQTISKERATGSYGTVSREQLSKPATNIAQRLIGTIAGVQAKSLDVDGTPVFEIRGQTSLYGNARPLIVVDGFPVQGDFTSINPNDVESITVLKDAAAASIWGARSANGVVVIVTKSARKGHPFKMEFSAFTRIGQKADLDYVNPLASSTQTVDYEQKAFNNWSAQINSGALATNYGKAWSPATVAMSEHYLGYITTAQRDAILAQLATQDNRQQIKDNLLSNPINQQYNLTLSGSSGKMSNILSLMFANNQSNFKETGDKQYMVNYRTVASPFSWLDINLSAMLQYTRANNSGVALSDIQNISPYEMLVNDDGSLTNISQYYWPILQRFVPMNLFPYSDWTYNPLQEINNRKLTTTQLNARVQAGLTFKIIRGLSFDSKIQYELFNVFNKGLYNENTFYVRNTVNTAATWDQATNKITLNLPKGSILTQSRTKAESYNFRNQFNFNRVFTRRHEINFVAGTEVNNIVTESFGSPITYGYNDKTLTLGTFPNGPGGTFFPIKNWMGTNQTFSYTNSFTYATERYFSYFGNAAYTFDGKYTISGSYRTDASNLITDDPQYRYAPFWSVGGGWQVYKESFMNKVSWVDRLNVRLTYGYNGNVDKTTAFRPLIATTAIPNVYTGDYTATVSSYGNPTLRWERTGSWNLGVDYSLFGGRLFGKVDAYHKSGKDLIALISIPAVNGTTSQRLNNAAMTNKGIELELGSALRIRGNDISWRGNLSFSYNKNTITRLFVAQYAASTLTGGGSAAFVVGENANTLWRYQYAGVYNKQPMVQGPKGTMYDFGAFTPGDGRDYLLNMGTTVAPYTLGFMNSFKIYDFDVSFIVTGKFGHVFQRKGFNYPPTWTSRVLPNNKLSEVVNGDMMKIVPLPQNLVEPRYYFWDRFHQNLSYLIENASHIRMQEVNITYNLPQRLFKKAGMNLLQVYAQGNNLFTILANNSGEDPEYPLGTMKPQPKLTLGIKCEF